MLHQWREETRVVVVRKKLEKLRQERTPENTGAKPKPKPMPGSCGKRSANDMAQEAEAECSKTVTCLNLVE